MVFFSDAAGAEAEPSVRDVTYTELELNPLKRSTRKKGRAKKKMHLYNGTHLSYTLVLCNDVMNKTF